MKKYIHSYSPHNYTITTMSKVATNFVNQYNLTPQMNIAELGNYAEKICKDLKDYKARDHARNRIQKLGFSKDQTYALIPIQTSGRCVVE